MGQCLVSTREVCPDCRRPKKVCLCEYFPSDLIDSPFVCIILQHPLESKRKKRTDWIFQKIMRNTAIIKCRSVACAKSEILRSALSDPSSCAIVYPTTGALPLTKGDAPTIKTLIFLDGTWQFTKEMFNASPELHALPRFKLSISEDYRGAFVIRKPSGLQDADFAPVSTAEAVSLAVDQLTGSTARQTATRRVLQAYSDQQLAFTTKVKHLPEKRDYIPGLYYTT
jgi:DTW domain-containing protein YfiP